MVGHAEGQGVACTDHTRDRSNVIRLSGCLQTGLPRKEGHKLVTDERGQLLHNWGQHPRRPVAYWVWTIIHSFGLLKRSHYHTCPWRPGTKDK